MLRKAGVSGAGVRASAASFEDPEILGFRGDEAV